jgi:peroxiredoxin
MQLARVRVTLTGVFLLATGVAWGQEGKGQGGGRPSRADDPNNGPAAAATIGQPAPDFTLLDSNGKKHALSDYKDKLVVLEWVNQECPWSLKAVPVVKDLRKKYGDKGVVWLGIDSTWSRKPEDDAKYAKDKELDFAILMDSDGKVGHLYGAKTTPHLFVVNKGRLVYMGGLHNDQYGRKPPAEFRNYVDEALAAVLAGKDVPLPETTAWGCRVGYQDGVNKSAKPPKKDVGQNQKEK